jgi:hypothetical protein
MTQAADRAESLGDGRLAEMLREEVKQCPPRPTAEDIYRLLPVVRGAR